jgi:hypothetical protein
MENVPTVWLRKEAICEGLSLFIDLAKYLFICKSVNLLLLDVELCGAQDSFQSLNIHSLSVVPPSSRVHIMSVIRRKDPTFWIPDEER